MVSHEGVSLRSTNLPDGGLVFVCVVVPLADRARHVTPVALGRFVAHKKPVPSVLSGSPVEQNHSEPAQTMLCWGALARAR